MKKNGFTLAEILITLTIIGVVAAATIPGMLARNVDRNKGRVIAIVRSIEDKTQELLNDPQIYYYNDATELGDNVYACEGLGCWEQPKRAPYDNDNFQGNRKYQRIIASELRKFGGVENNNTTTTFHPLRDVNCELSLRETRTPVTNGNLRTIINTYNLTIDFDLDEPRATYPAQNPNRYTFRIDNDGHVHGIDALARAYLLNPTELNNREADLEKAEELANQ